MKKTRKRKTQKPKGWVDHPKTLADVLNSMKAIGCDPVTRLGHNVDPRKIKL